MVLTVGGYHCPTVPRLETAAAAAAALPPSQRALNEKLMSIIKDALKRRGGKSSSQPSFSADSIIGKELLGESEIMEEIFYKIEKIAPTDANILILGENGTGKDMIATGGLQTLWTAGTGNCL